MKFLNFVSCCGSSGEIHRQETEIPAEETRSLVRSPLIRRRKRGRLAGVSAENSSEWKPSLCSISEENDVVEKSDRRRENDHRTVGSERFMKRKSATRTRQRTNVTTLSDDYRRSSFPVVIPAFSPTPFMF